MISLTTFEFDVNGHIVIQARPKNLYEGARRGSVTATFDGVSHYDTGYFVSDKTLFVTVQRPNKTLLEQLQYLIAHYPAVRLSCETGSYRCTVSYGLSNTTLSLQLRILERLN